jgi:hypothetical protein
LEKGDRGGHVPRTVQSAIEEEQEQKMREIVAVVVVMMKEEEAAQETVRSRLIKIGRDLWHYTSNTMPFIIRLNKTRLEVQCS